MSGLIALAGGWGYGNIGDDLLLKSYIEVLGSDITILSVNVASTKRAIAEFGIPVADLTVLSETARLKGGTLLVCGGGYLNGDWKRCCTAKLLRILRLSRAVERVVVHATETRNLHPHQAALLGRIVREDAVSVRDMRSHAELRRAGIHATVVPDALALSSSFRFRPERVTGESPVFVNVLDVPSRVDRHEAMFPWVNWEVSIKALIGDLEGEVQFLANDPREAQYVARTFPGYPIRTVGSTKSLEDSLRGSRGIISTRMHYGLLASKMGKPARIIPYNGKVVPTLDELNLAQLVLDPTDYLVPVLDDASLIGDDAWQAARHKSLQWLQNSLKP